MNSFHCFKQFLSSKEVFEKQKWKINAIFMAINTIIKRLMTNGQ